MEPPDTLAMKLHTLRRFFDLEKIAATRVRQDYVTAYYAVNRLAYSRFHNRRRFVHMGISQGDSFRVEDLAHQAEQMHALIGGRSGLAVLELAPGRGGNATWLADRNPGCTFLGLDASPAQLGYARRAARALPNLRFAFGDYHDLGTLEDASVDLAFVVEALCHSDRPEIVLGEVARVLRPGGLFAVHDGYREKPEAETTPDEALAARLLETGVAVAHFQRYGELLALAEQAGLEVVEKADHSRAVLPSMMRFERKAAGLLARPLPAHLVARALPAKFTWNIVAGYLFPDLIRSGVFSYRYTLFRKSGAG